MNLIHKIITFISEGFYLAAKSYGFHSWESMSNYIFLITNKSVTFTLLIVSFTISINGWIEVWVFSPVYTFIVFMSLMVAEVLFGTIKAVTVDNERFNWDKFARVIPKFISHTFALSAAYHMAIAEPLFTWMPSTVFIFFSIQNFMKSILHLVDIKLLDGSFANFMREKFAQNNDFIPTDKKDNPEDKIEKE